MIACFLSNISAKYYKNPSMLSRVIAKNVGMFFFETQCRSEILAKSSLHRWRTSPCGRHVGRHCVGLYSNICVVAR